MNMPTPKVRESDDLGQWYCPECKTWLPQNHFTSDRERRGATRSISVKCKGCRRLARYNLSRDQYEYMMLSQGGKCAICHRNAATVIDHDHTCCKSGSCGSCVRGILCSGCNVGIGMFRDNLGLMSDAMTYLARSVV